MAGGDRRTARRQDPHRSPRRDLPKDLVSQNVEFPDRHGRAPAASSLRTGVGQGARPGPATREPAPLRLQDDDRRGQDLGDGNGGGLGPLPSAARARLGSFHERPHRGAERHRVPAAGEGLREQPDLPQAAADSPGVEGQLLAEGDPALRVRRARPVRESLPHQRPPALRVARSGVDTGERGRGDPGAEAGAGPCGLRPALHAGQG